MNTVILSTDELPTVHGGAKGTVWRQHHKHPEFFLVLIHTVGEAFYFHQSQLAIMNPGINAQWPCT